MPLFTIDFREGFKDDHVVARIDRNVVFDKTGIRTRNQIGHAATATVELDQGAHTIAISLPEGRGEASLRIDPTIHAFLGVDRIEGGLRLTPSATPFHYL